MRIGIYAPGLGVGPQSAPSACLRQMCRELAERDGIELTHLHHGHPVDWCHDLRVPRLPVQCERKINEVGFDVVHFNTFVDMVSPALISAPTVLTYHGDVHWELPGVTGSRIGDFARRALERSKIPQYDRVLTVSSDLGRRVRERYRRFGVDPITVYNGIDHEQFTPSGRSTSDVSDVRTPYVLHVSNYTEKKNPEGILRAFARVNDVADAPLVICGRGWRTNTDIRELITALELDDRVTLTGYVSKEALISLYQNAAMFLYPSLHESFGLPIVEAMACGTPVVTADRYAPPEIAGDAALTCNPTSPQEIANCVRRILVDPNLAATLSERGIKRARTFSWNSTVDRILRIYSRS